MPSSELPGSPLEPLDSQIVAPNQASSWRTDPWSLSTWRWWDGKSWTNFTADRAKPPILRPSLSWPVVLCAIPSLVIVLLYSLGAAIAVPLALVPFLYLAILIWFDRLEPMAWTSRLHAFLWGATVAVVLAYLLNTLFASATDFVWSAIVSAPLVEEFGKGLAVYWAVRRKEVTSATTGIVIACWAGLGFAVFEDINYFAGASVSGNLAPTLLARGATGMAHSLFTSCIGLAIGLSVQREQPLLRNAIWGYGIAISLHSLFNASLTYFASSLWRLIVLDIAYLFIAAAMLALMWRLISSETSKFESLLPFIAHRQKLPDSVVELFSSRAGRWRARRSLERKDRKDFDRFQSALAQLAILFRRNGLERPQTEAILGSQIHSARQNPQLNRLLEGVPEPADGEFVA